MRKRRDSYRLDPLTVASLIKTAKPGRYADGGGLYLVVDQARAARWVFLFRWKPNKGLAGPGKLREMGLGGSGAVSLKRAREKALSARAQVADGIDPIAARKAETSVPTFGEIADEVLEAKIAETRSDATIARLKRALEVYALSLRPLRVDLVDTAGVLDCLKPLWLTKPETAKKTRALIEQVLSAAKAKGWRQGDNPAAWRGHLDQLLPRPAKLSRGHHAAMPFEALPDFVATLRTRDAMSALALEFLILTAARSAEVLGATWSEINLKTKIWTLPPSRTKAGREHRVPLSQRAVEILETAGRPGQATLCFRRKPRLRRCQDRHSTG